MSPDVTSPAPESEPQVMGSIDADGTDRRFVIADIAAEDAWISVRIEGTYSLADCR